MNSNSCFDNESAYYSLFLTVYGTVGNTITLIVCCQKKMRIRPTFVFLSFKAVADTIPLYLSNLNTYFIFKFGYGIDDLNMRSCKLTTMLAGSAMEASSVLMVSDTNAIDIYLFD